MKALAVLLLSMQAVQPAAPSPAYVPQRVYDGRRQSFSDFEVMLADLARADVIFVGEQHDDPNTHRLEAAILDGLRRRGAQLTVSLEMFERDVQPALDSYLAGSSSEDEFLKSSRPWPRYATDYRGLVEMAKSERWPVVAANVPRRIAAQAAKGGPAAIDQLTPEDRAFTAAELRCPLDAYFDRFWETMTGHPIGGDGKGVTEERRATTERYFFSQCVKDETMAESIAARVDASGRRPVVHVTGSFHSDFGHGTPERVRRRAEGRRVAIVSIVPVKDLDAVAPSAEDLRRADYLLYTIQ
ncbi:MAG TPA: ChaN family lipoprotein [Vicinamibacterales bacterium]|nr:ChaN family lipoprotein [Vicinamibacterales bacterium]